MPSRLDYIRRFIPLLALVLSAAAALPQSLNREAMKWFDAGLAERDAAKRIAAYTKAVETDPNFAEALFNLAVACKEQKDYDRAEQYFRRAANTAKTDLRVKALSEMASIYNIRGNYKSYESALREAKTLAVDSKQRAVLSYELGRLLYQQGRYEQSAVELKDGRGGDPAKRDAFDNLIKLAENSSELDYLYASAEKQKAAGSLQEAKATLEQIKAKNANFRDVQTKLNEVETLLAADAGKTTIAAAPATDKTNINDGEAEKAYAEGLLAIRQRDWARAIAAFEKTLQLNPEHREAREKLAGALMFLERDNVEAVAARYYDEGVAAMNRNNLDSALVLLGKVQKINRQYRDVASLYAQVEAALRLNSAATPQPPPALVAESAEPAEAASAALDSLYQIASAAFARGEWNHAVMGFQKIRMQQANYRDVDQLFAAARSKLLALSATAEVDETISLSRPSPLMIGGVAIAVAGFFAAGFVFFSPVARARYQSRRGNDGMAALIYESLLARRPNRLKLYPALAEIYLRLDRRDEAAMKIYRRVLELNLPSRHRADFNEMVTRNMGEANRINSAAIAKIEALMPEPEPMPAVNGVLLADGGFHMQEKTPAPRPRKKKEAEASSNGTASAPVAEEGAAEAVAGEAPQVQAPVKPRKPRKKKTAPAPGGVENGVVIADAAVNGELQLAEPAPVKKPRRKKVMVVDAVGVNGTSTYPSAETVEALEARLRPDGVALAEPVLPAENEVTRDEPVSV